MEKKTVLQRINPLNLNPVVLLIAALVVEILFELLWRMLAENGVITSNEVFLIGLYGVQFLSKSVFFIIILYYRRASLEHLCHLRPDAVEKVECYSRGSTG